MASRNRQGQDQDWQRTGRGLPRALISSRLEGHVHTILQRGDSGTVASRMTQAPTLVQKNLQSLGSYSAQQRFFLPKHRARDKTGYSPGDSLLCIGLFKLVRGSSKQSRSKRMLRARRRTHLVSVGSLPQTLEPRRCTCKPFAMAGKALKSLKDFTTKPRESKVRKYCFHIRNRKYMCWGMYSLFGFLDQKSPQQ